MSTSHETIKTEGNSDNAVINDSQNNGVSDSSVRSDDVLPGYRFIKKLGSGSQATVFLAKRKEDNKQVAIKRLNVESVKNWKEYELFRREADVLSSLHIQGVAEFYEAIEKLDDDPPYSYIVQEYIPGLSLQNMINKGERFSINRVYDIILQMLDILEALHTHSPTVIHRDIKPSNIILKNYVDGLGNDAFQVYLIDFGAVANPQIQGGGSTVAGTFGYMAPEQLTGNPTPATDIYALGAVAVFLLTGISPGEMMVRDYRLIFDTHLQNMMPAVTDTLRMMLEPDQSIRIRDYDFLRKRFRDFKLGKFEQISLFSSWNELNQKIHQVKKYCQPGNIEIWQRLPDAGNRDAIPNLYKMIKENTEALDKVDIHVLDKRLKTLKIAALVALAVVIVAYLNFGFEFQFKCVLVIACLLMITLASSVYSEAHAKADISKNYDKYDAIKNDLLKNGRKCIATIKKIEYVKMDTNEIDMLFKKNGDIILSSNEDWYTYKFEFDKEGKAVSSKKLSYKDNNLNSNELTHLKRSLQNHKIVGPMYYHGTPKFRITYAFNPPDDKSPYDLLHTIDTHIEPDDSIKVGDPIPILYRIINEKKKEYVDSMPFPVPLSDIVRLSDVIYAEKIDFRSVE